MIWRLKFQRITKFETDNKRYRVSNLTQWRLLHSKILFIKLVSCHYQTRRKQDESISITFQTFYKGCAVQVEGVQQRLRKTLCSPFLNLHCRCISERTAHSQPILHTISLYCTNYIRGAETLFLEVQDFREPTNPSFSQD